MNGPVPAAQVLALEGLIDALVVRDELVVPAFDEQPIERDGPRLGIRICVASALAGATQLVDHRAADTQPRVRLERDAPPWLEPIDRIDQPEERNRLTTIRESLGDLERYEAAEGMANKAVWPLKS